MSVQNTVETVVSLIEIEIDGILPTSSRINFRIIQMHSSVFAEDWWSFACTEFVF